MLVNKKVCMFSIVSIIVGLMPILGCSSSSDGEHSQEVTPPTPVVEKFRNPIISTSLPDPSIVRTADGVFYLFATEDIRNLPIYRSTDLIKWQYVGTAFNDDSRPRWNPQGGIWAPDINYVDGKYMLYYSKSTWGGEWTCGLGVASADKPQGPYTDHGALFISEDIGVQNSIDPFYIEDGGKKYIFWGSFHGIYGIELSDDGMSIKPGSKPVQIAGNQMEATYIHRRDGYYYLFGSNGSCCEGNNSTYQVIYGRSQNLFGPYVTKDGKRMLDGNFDVLLHGGSNVAGPGHNAEFITDDKGQDWMIYHGYMRSDPDAGRQVMMDRVEWYDGWPLVSGAQSSIESNRPYFNKE